ncbi:MAG: hypothetical protein KDC76_04735 [Bacteroidetes bacterium]|nr:hypothetical protein [Bacteroidota bacterium]
MSRKMTLRILILIPFLAFSNLVFGQGNLTLYNMKTIPQRIYTNPARQSDAKNFLAMPVISSQYLNFSNSAFSLNSILSAVEEGPGSSTLNINKVGDIFQAENYIGLDHSMDLLSMGFKIKKKTYLYLTSSLNQQFRFTYPGDFFDLITQGNGGDNLNRTFDLAFGVDFLQYMDAGIGINRTFLGDKLTIGARYRWLKGLNVVHTERNAVTFRTDPQTFDLTATSDIMINVASSVFIADSLNQIDPSDGEKTRSNGYFTKPNTGSALDFGVEFRPTKKLTFSAAVNNLGKINWDQTSFSYGSKTPGATYTFQGVHVDDIFNEEADFNQALERVKDTLEERFQLEERSATFTTNLFAEMYVGGQFNLSKDHNAGLLFYGDFYNKKLYPAFTVSWNSKLTNLLAVSASYTARSNSYVNLGLGLSINLGPFQFYAVSDNVGGVFAPMDVKNLNLRTGFNLAMQRKDPNAKADKQAKKEEKKQKKEEEKKAKNQ